MARAQRMKHWRFLYSLNLVRDMLLRLRGQRTGFDSTYWSQGGLGQVFTGTGDCARILFFKMRPALVFNSFLLFRSQFEVKFITVVTSLLITPRFRW
jgi:hypothetical protein